MVMHNPHHNSKLAFPVVLMVSEADPLAAEMQLLII
jgi:hypothetical protein